MRLVIASVDSMIDVIAFWVIMFHRTTFESSAALMSSHGIS
jgi:hypothetical protein